MYQLNEKVILKVNLLDSHVPLPTEWHTKDMPYGEGGGELIGSGLECFQGKLPHDLEHVYEQQPKLVHE